MKKMKGLYATLLYTGGYLAYLLSQWLVSIVIVNVSGLDDAGYFGVALTLTSVFYMVASYGIRSYQISDLKPLFRDIDYIAARIVTTLVGFVGCMLYSVLSGYNQKQLIIIGLYMFFKCCEALYDVLHGIWQKSDKLTMVGISLLIKAVVGIISFLVPYVISGNLIMGLLCMAISAVVLLGCDYFYSAAKFQVSGFWKSDFKSISTLLKATFVMMVLILCAPALPALPRIILERTAGREILGIYTSLATPTTLISAFASTVFLPLIPRYTVAYHSGNSKEIAKLIATSTTIMLGIGCVACVAVHFLGHWAVNLVYGEEVAVHYELMHGVIVSTVLASIIMCLNNLLVGIRKLRHELGFMVLGCVLCLFFSVFFVPRFAMVGAIGATVFSQAVQICFELIYIVGLLKRLKGTDKIK